MHHRFVLPSVLDNLASLPLLLPELLLAGTLVAVLVLGLVPLPYQRSWCRGVALVGVVWAGCSKYWVGSQLAGRPALSLFNQLLVLDSLGVFFCLLLCGITLPLLLLAPAPALHRTETAYAPWSGVWVLSGLLGSCLLVMAFHWLALYLALTLLTLTSTLLIGSQGTPSSAVASLQYLLYSMATTAVMLGGMSYLYGFTGTLVLCSPAAALSLQALPGPVVLVLFLLCLSHVFFVLAAVPYHGWVPEVYQGSQANVVAYLATVPKLAAVAVLLRWFGQCLPQLSPVLQAYAQQGLAVLALLTLVVGHTAALLQKDIQQLMAWATVAQGGLLLAGVVAAPSSPLSVLYYSAVYGVMGLAVWIGMQVLHERTGSKRLQDWAGLGRKLPVLGSSLTLVMLALIGLPPTAGFTGKFLLFTGLWAHAQHTGSSLYLALWIVSLLSTVLSLYYYLKLPFTLFASAPSHMLARPQAGRAALVILVFLAMLLVVGFGAVTSLMPVLDWCRPPY